MYAFVCYGHAMEATMAEKGEAMTEWNDGRLDDLSERVDRIETKMDAGFARLETKMDEGFGRIDAKFDVFNERFESMHQMLFKASWGLVIGLLGLLGLLTGVIATGS
jgi:hypothetical protein